METMRTLVEEQLSDSEKLVRIMTMIENVLSEVVRAREILFSGILRDHVEAAWNEVRPGIKDLQSRLADPGGLKEAGLTGSSLSLKYQGIFESYERLNQKGGVRRLKRFLRWAKIVVGSLATMVPGLKEVIEILNEYMEASEMGIEDAESAS